MSSLARIVVRTKRRLGTLGIWGVIVLLLTWVPTIATWGNWLSPIFRFLLTNPGRLALTLAGLCLIATGVFRPKKYDLGTLKGRTLKLRDELQKFIDETPKPSDSMLGVGTDDMIRGIERLHQGASLYAAKLEHEFYLRFEKEAQQIRWEFGKRGIQSRALTEALSEKKYDSIATYATIIKALDHLSHVPEASEPISAG